MSLSFKDGKVCECKELNDDYEPGLLCRWRDIANEELKKVQVRLDDLNTKIEFAKKNGFVENA